MRLPKAIPTTFRSFPTILEPKSRLPVASTLPAQKPALPPQSSACGQLRAERLPEISFNASYGGGGVNPANYNRIDEVSGSIWLSHSSPAAGSAPTFT